MTHTYSGDPNKTDLDKVRFLVGDTDMDQPFMSNAEIEYLLVEYKDPKVAAQHACMGILAKLAREVDYAIGPEKVSARQRYTNYRSLYNSLLRSRLGAHAAPTWQGLGNRTRPGAFDIGMHDNKGWY